MLLHPDHHADNVLYGVETPMYQEWLQKNEWLYNGEHPFAQEMDHRDVLEIFTEGCGHRCTTEQERPPDVIYGEWGDVHPLLIGRGYRNRHPPITTLYEWYFTPYPVSWLLACDVCGALGVEAEDKVEKKGVDIINTWGRPEFVRKAYRELFRRDLDHVCSRCLDRDEVREVLRYTEAASHLLNLTYISRMGDEARAKRCASEGLNEEHTALVEAMATLRIIKKAIKEAKQIHKEVFENEH